MAKQTQSKAARTREVKKPATDEPATKVDPADEAPAEPTAKQTKTAAVEKDKLTEVPTDPQADNQAVVGAFVKVINGEHQGRYGVLVEAHSLDNAVVRTRDSMNERIVTKYSDLVPAEAGGR